jgi:hypothetical protein
VGATLGWFQLDHQLDNGIAPVMLAPTPVATVQPTLQVSILKDNLRSSDTLHSYLYCAILLQEMDLKVEEDIVGALYEFVCQVLLKRSKRMGMMSAEGKGGGGGGGGGSGGAAPGTIFRNTFDATEEEESKKRMIKKTREEVAEVEAKEGGSFLGMKFYVEHLQLGTIKVNVSYIKGQRIMHMQEAEGGAGGGGGADGAGGKIGGLGGGLGAGGGKKETLSTKIERNKMQQMRQRGVAVDEDADDFTSMFIMTDFPSIMSAVIPSLTDAPIRLNAKSFFHIFENGTDIVSSLKDYYTNEGLKQIYKVIGSLDFMGNPTQLFNSLGTGVRDFFYEPAAGIIKSPTALGTGIFKGTLSLVSHTTSGVFTFASLMSSQVATSVATLSLDDDWKARHARSQQGEKKRIYNITRKRDAVIIVVRPFRDIIGGVVGGVTGVLTEPYKGYKKKGGKGFVMGVASGLIGIPAKPIVGLADAFSHGTEFFRDVATGINLMEKRLEAVKRRRLP